MAPPSTKAADKAAIEASALDLQEDLARIAALREKNPFGSTDRKLDLPPIEGYKLHWFVAKPGRVERALQAGWTYILDEEGKPRSQVSGQDGVRMYAMKIPMQFWLEDVARSDAKAKAARDAVKTKPDHVEGARVSRNDEGKFYTPEGRTGAVTETVTR